ncbi:methyl-accepting chemotaxis protein [Chitinibacteraceae bacterium HSL-7]
MLNRFTVAVRITLGFAVLLAVSLCAEVAGLWGIKHLQTEVHTLLERDLTYYNHIVATGRQVGDLRRYEKDNFLNFTSSEKVAEYREKWTKAYETAKSELASADKLAPPAQRTEIERLLGALDQYYASFGDVSKRIQAGEFSDAVAINAAFTPAKEPIRNMQEALEALSEDALKRANDIDGTVVSIQGQITLIVVSLAAIAVALCVVIAWVIIRSVRSPLNQLQSRLGEIASSGRLSLPIDTSGNDEIAQTAQSAQSLMNGLNDVISNANRSSVSLLEAARSLDDAADQVTTASAQQSEAASATAAAIEQLSVSVNLISDNARLVSTEAQQTLTIAGDGAETAKTATDVMRRISGTLNHSTEAITQLNQRSDEIGTIALTIKDIADQTNLLALNAAIEAARAGEQGRGFAVVADEVRKLAERTTQATVEISSKIGAVQQDTVRASSGMMDANRIMEEGVGKTEELAQALRDIVHRAEETVEQVRSMAHAINEQSQASQDIARNVERIAQASEENHSAAASTADLSHELSRLATELDHAISRYRH